jgi:hypothetical protein
MYCRRAKKGIYCCELGARATATGAEDVTPAASLTQTKTQPQERAKGGRPSGTTNKKKFEDVRVMISTKNEIAHRFFTEKNAARKKLKRGRLDEIITEVKKRNNLSEDVVINKTLIRSRIKKNIFVRNGHSGPSSPLASIEPHIVEMLIVLSKMRESLTPGNCINLINSLLVGTETQKALIAWKKQYSHGESGTIGYGYWLGLKKRHADKICSKRGQKYELDRDKWTTYANFHQMYELVYKQMEEAGVAVRLETPQ